MMPCITPEEYEILEKYTLALFKRGTEIAAERGLILVDTKYEFGKHLSLIHISSRITTASFSVRPRIKANGAICIMFSSMYSFCLLYTSYVLFDTFSDVAGIFFHKFLAGDVFEQFDVTVADCSAKRRG